MLFASQIVKRRSLIDDVSPKESKTRGQGGYSILFENRDIRQMLTLAKTSKDDIFYDLGCGLGQNLKIALTEYDVRKVVGIERNKKRARKAEHRLEQLGFSKDRYKIINRSFDDLLEGKIKDASLKEATIVFYGLSSTPELVADLERLLRRGCRLVYYYNCLIPEIMPDRKANPFYVSVAPFKKTTSVLKWLRKVVFWQRSSLYKRGLPSNRELWDELSHDCKVQTNPDSIIDYKKRLFRLR
jgi:SAM-dependent methyltransferase